MFRRRLRKPSPAGPGSTHLQDRKESLNPHQIETDGEDRQLDHKLAAMEVEEASAAKTAEVLDAKDLCNEFVDHGLIAFSLLKVPGVVVDNAGPGFRSVSFHVLVCSPKILSLNQVIVGI